MQQTETSVESGEPTPIAASQPQPVVEDAPDESIAASAVEELGQAGPRRDDSTVEDGDDTAFEDGEPAGPQAQTDVDDAAENSGATSEVGGERVYTDRELNAARRFGISPEDLDALGDGGKELAERLAKTDSEIGRRYSKIGQAERDLRRRESADDAEPGDARPDGPPSDDSAGASAPVAQDDRIGAMAQEMARLREQVSSLAAERQSGDRQKVEAATDRFFAELDGEIYPQFGAGPWAKLPEDSNEFGQRRELVTKAGEILRGYELVHGQAMDVAEALDQALSIVAPEARVAADRRKLSADLRRRARQRIARPTQRRTARAYESSEERTAEALDHWEKARGVRFFDD